MATTTIKQKRPHSWMPAVILTFCGAMATLTSCINEIDNPAPVVVVTDDKPFDLDQYIDASVRPGNDFFRYALGKWVDDTSIPSHMNLATQNIEKVMGQVLRESNDPFVSAMRQLVSAVNDDDSADFQVLKSRIDYLSAISTQEELLAAFSQLHQWGYTPLVRLRVDVYEGVIVPVLTSERPSCHLNYPMGLHDKSMLSDLAWELCVNLRDLGFTDERINEIHDNAMVIEEAETDAYDNSYLFMLTTPLQQPLTRGSDEENAQRIFELMGIGDLADQMIVYSNIIPIINLLFDGSDKVIAQIRDYMIFYILGQDFVFVPRMKLRNYSILDEAVKYATYHMFRLQVETMGEENIHKEQCREIMVNFRTILIKRIDELDWMSSVTKQKAQKKAQQMTFCIGYPDQWSDEFTPVIKESTLVEAVGSLRRQSADWMHNLAGRSMQTNAWDYWCSTCRFSLVTAFYEPCANQLMIMPAHIVAPYFDPNKSEAALYASAYAFSHEMSHGFDAYGSHYDEKGLWNNWWTDEDLAAFQQKQQQLIALNSQFEFYPGQPVDSEKTLDEDMADLGGFTLAYETYKCHLKDQGFVGQQFDDQLKKFFLSFGIFMGSDNIVRDLDLLKWQYLYDTHSAAHNRVNGIVRLFDDWYRLFDVKPTDALYLAPEDRVKIW